MKRLCPTCRGAGTITDPQFIRACQQGPMFYGGPPPTVPCESCAGSGWVVELAPTTRPAYPLIPHDLTTEAR